MTRFGDEWCLDARRKGDIVRRGERIITKPSDEPSDARWASEKTLADDYRLAVRYVILGHLEPVLRRFSTATILREIESRTIPVYPSLLDRIMGEHTRAGQVIDMGNDCWAPVRGATKKTS